ncbi:MAG: prolyl oligopeptidase family serine peptidase [Verrucomicrobiales bacterium]|nr:prolyl oligopeptidase family serine peptidase [Verrucomicrobiales bacterium]MCP5556743.1 prolyl oligopeptidase family serine peptidase [Verrucomicrobiaceae bacterium]
MAFSLQRAVLFLAIHLFAIHGWSADDLSKRTENTVFRDHLKANWLPDGKSFWYRVQTGPQTHEFVLIEAETGARKTAQTLKVLGLPESDALKTSAVRIELRKTSRTGGESGFKFINKLDADVDLFWINQQGEHASYGRIRANSTREQHTFDGHVWLITSRTGEHLAVVEAEATVKTLIIDGKGIAEAAADPKKRPEPGRSPDGACVVVSQADAVAKRQITIIDSTPQDSFQPKTKVIDYVKPGDPLPQPQLVITAADGHKIPVPRNFHENPFSPDGRIGVTWSPDSAEFYFDYNQRGHQLYRILAANAKTGAVRVVVEERSKTFIDYTQKTWRHWLHQTGELIWMSERDGWCHLWLYDTKTGTLKNQITKGTWPVREVLHVDEAKREIWFLASGLRKGEDPYHLHLCRVNFDGSGFKQLTEGDGNHLVEFSPKRDFFIDAWSRSDHPPVTELRRSQDGSLVCELERADVTALLSVGWTMPERFVAKGRDGTTDIHGVIIKPSNFDPAKHYPVVENIYAGPHGAFAPKDFGRLLGHHSIAELGFIVVQMDGMGTNHRGKTFHDVCWKNLKDAGFPDRKLWIKAAAKTRPWMDISRVGIYGGSAGGQNAMRALLDHHDFYKVAVADCGCHDNRMDKIWWNEQWMGWPVDDSYKRSSNFEDARRLEGHLLLIVGELDTNVDPASTMQVVGALQRANKSFEFMPIIGAGHGAAETPIGSRLRMEFLVKHLQP